ncbi:MAG: methyltransferase domain-containing protein [Myxococcota bacterium]
MTRYDTIGDRYSARRREDPQIRARIHEALGNARTVVNVGAGAGSYEPQDRTVFAVEPSHVMAEQRAPDRPALRGTATALPFFDGSLDAAMTVLSLHHWDPDQEAGVREMARVARDTIVILTIDAEVSGRMWLMADYFPEVRNRDFAIFPPPEQIAAWTGRRATIETIPVSRTTPDHSLASFWAHPERVLDPLARQVTSGFAREPQAVIDRVVAAVRTDLESGAWDARHGALRHLEEADAGLRLIVAKS